jgi:hypothetical protein
LNVGVIRFTFQELLIAGRRISLEILGLPDSDDWQTTDPSTAVFIRTDE